MAGADYFHCDKCGAKCFYDANLNWDRDAGAMQNRPESPKLDYTGDIAALCDECAATFEVIVREKAKERASEAIKKIAENTMKDVNEIRQSDTYSVAICLVSLIEAIGIAVSVLEEKP